MTILYVLAAAAIWFGLGVLNAGLLFASFQDEYPELAERDRALDRRLSLIVIPFGPLVLIPTCLSIPLRHGWRWPGLRG